MKKSINLLAKRRLYEQGEKVFQGVRISIVVFGTVCMMGLIAAYLLKTEVTLKHKSLLDQKEKYLSELLGKKDIEKKVVFLNEKSAAIENILKKDVRFLDYYRFVEEHLPFSTPAAQIIQIGLDNKREVSFTLAYPTFNDFYVAMEAYENSEFLRNFENLTMNGYKISSEKQAGEEGEAFEIILNGTLKPL